MITLRDMLNAGIEIQGTEVYVKHFDYQLERADVYDTLMNVRREGSRNKDLMDMEVTFIYPCEVGGICIEVHERDY